MSKIVNFLVQDLSKLNREELQLFLSNMKYQMEISENTDDSITGNLLMNFIILTTELLLDEGLPLLDEKHTLVLLKQLISNLTKDE